MPRFVILRHDPGENSTHPRHWDFMLERGDVLRTWALAVEPGQGEMVEARLLPDHRLAYLDYEGEVSGGRGTVTRCESGTYQAVSESDAGLVIQLSGTRLRGQATLTRGETSADCWRFQFS
jgi:hypothetical protein